MNARAHASLLAAVIAAFCTVPAHAGDTDPPTGPITPTMKTLDEVEPRTIINAANTPGDADSTFKITAPGSYYLTANIAGEAAKHGIEIAADDVSVDLMGFQLLGVPGSLDGVHVSAFPSQGAVIRNGSVEAWGGDGVDIRFSRKCRIEDVQASNCDFGFNLGQSTIVTRCIASENVRGFRLDFSCVLTECVAMLSDNQGFLSGEGCLVSRCAAIGNGQTGISVNNDNLVSECVSTENGASGINIAFDSMVSDCTTSGNTLNGIVAGRRSVVVNNACSSNDGAGILIALDVGRIDGNHCNANATGIEVQGSRNVIIGNSCADNTGAGILVAADAGRIDGNHCTANATGIDVDGAANYIIRNTCIDNTTNNFDFAGDNRFGTIVNHTLSSTAPITGNAAASSIGTEDPWANFAGETPP